MNAANTRHRPPSVDRRVQPLGLVLSLLVVLLAAPPAAAQWTTQSPLPTHLDVRGVAAPTAQRVFVATADDSFDSGGALWESADGGATWVQRDVPASLGDPLNGIFFLDEQHGWVWGNANYRTADGGTTWEALPSLGSTYHMAFSTVDFGVASGNSGVMVSTDGGLTWAASPDGMFLFDFADALTGLGAAAGGVYRTTDGGTSFGLVQAGNADAVAFLSPTVAVAIVDGSFARSTDSGATWTPGQTAEGRTRLMPVSPDVVLAWGRSGSPPEYDDTVLRSADGGQTWTDLGEPVPAGIVALTVVDTTTVVAADLTGGMHRSTDGGQTWSETFVSPGPFPGFLSSAAPAFGDPLTGYFGFGSGYLLKTTDGGAGWAQLSSGAAVGLRGLARLPGGDLVAVGDGGGVLTSAGGAAPWTLRPAPTAADLVAVEPVGTQEAVAVDETGVVHRSSDGGATWSAGSPLPMSLDAHDLSFDTLLDGWVVGAGFGGAALFATTDGGASWTPVTDVQGQYVAVDFEGANGWAVRPDGLLQRTIDSGATWSEAQLPGSGLAVEDLDFWDPAVGYAVGAGGYAVRSDDGGLTWQPLPTPDSGVNLKEIHLVGQNELWVAGDTGACLYSATGGQSWAVVDAGPAGFGVWAAITASPSGDAWVAGPLGRIRQFTGPPPPPVNQPPEASFDFTTTGLSVDFSDGSSDPDGTIVSWLWDFGDGAGSSDPSPTHVYDSADTYIVRLTVTDDDGDDGGAVRFVVVQPGPGGTFGDFTEVTPLDPLFVTPQDEDFWVATTAPADYDGDGDLDIAVLGYYVVYNTSVDERLVLIRNDGPAAPDEWEFTYVDVPLGNLTTGASDMAWGDADGDGDQDLVVGTDGDTVLYRNDAGTMVATDTVLPGYWEDNDQADFDLRSISWADYDNDGDLDLLLPSVWDGATFSYRTALLRNDGPNGTGGLVFTEIAAGLAPTSHAQSAWADFDGDSDLDLLLVNLAPLTDDGFIRRYRNDGGGAFVGEDILGDLTIEHGEAQWGDSDLDGDLDVLVVGRVQQPAGTFNTVLRVYVNDADVYTPEDVVPCLGCEGWFDLTAASWADYDSDGDVDILLAGTYNPGSQIDGRAKVYDNDAGVFTDSGNQLPAPRASGSRGGSFTWLDLDQDGDLDYFIAGEYFVPGGNGLIEAQMHVYRNDAEGANQAPNAPSFLNTLPGGDGGSVVLEWNPATDDHTPAHALTYDLRLYSGGVPVADQRRLPEPGGLGAVAGWTLTGLAGGDYTWTLQAVDSAYNGGPVAEGAFTVGGVPPLFGDGFESGDLSAWSAVAP